MLEETARHLQEEAKDTIALALDQRTDVVFLHDPLCAEHVLDHRKPHQQVFLMAHSPMPFALYIAWSWGVPERDWREVMEFPDVASWVGRELDVWRQVDRLVLPSPEALGEFERIDPRFEAAARKMQYLLTGGARDEGNRETWMLPQGPVGVFLGNAESYRGLDCLLNALSLIPPSTPGTVAIAGPSPDTLPRHPRLRALGRVGDVPGLFRAVDFVINVNRFSLFDLSLIEATESGKPLLLHAVGGNKTFEILGAGVRMLSDLAPKTIAAGLDAMFSMAASDRARLGAQSRACYEAHLTPERFWKRHVELYQEVASEVARA